MLLLCNAPRTFPYQPYWADGISVGNFDNSTNWQELSGIATPNLDANSAWLWIESDSPANMIGGVSATNPATKFVLTLTGQTAMVDLEDITSVRFNGVNYLYGMDMGNNGNGADSRGSGIDMRIFRIVEPTITGSNISTSNFIEINAAFPGVNGPTLRDAESSFVDPVDGKLYIIIKRDAVQKVYSLAFANQIAGATQTLVYEGAMTSLPESRTVALTTTPCYAVSACMSKSGKEILVKNYSGIYYFPRVLGTDTVIQALQKALVSVSYVGGGTLPTPKTSHPNAEPQGEGVCFDFNDQDYFTNSEYNSTEGSSATAYPMFRYERLAKAPTTATFQDGVSPTAGYTGTVTTYIWGTNPDTDRSAETTFVVDFTSGNPTDDRRGLVKWDLSSIPTTARVVSAYIEMYISAEGQGIKAYRMLVPWVASSTFNTLVGGVNNDGVKASVAESFRNGINLDTVTATMWKTNALVADVQFWVSNPSLNQGLLMKGLDESAGGDGMQFDSKAGTTASRRPKLVIKYV